MVRPPRIANMCSPKKRQTPSVISFSYTTPTKHGSSFETSKEKVEKIHSTLSLSSNRANLLESTKNNTIKVKKAVSIGDS